MAALDGKVVWVTGAGSGIGEAVAVALAADGAILVLSGRRPEPLKATAETIRAAGGEFLVEPLDVAEASDVDDVAATIEERYGRLDILVNNAGINIPNRTWATYNAADWDQVLRINLNGVMYGIAAALPIMRRQQDGLIITISSWAGRFDGYLSGAAYGASKHAVLSLNASLNIEECANGIRGCAICPGEVATPILDRRPQPVSAETRARLLQPEDLAETVRYVASMPPRVCVNEILISPTLNRGYLAQTGKGG